MRPRLGGTVLGKYSTVAIRENIMLKFSHLRLLCHVKKVVYRIEYRLQMLSVSVYKHKILILCDAGREKARLSGDQRDPSSPPACRNRDHAPCSDTVLD